MLHLLQGIYIPNSCFPASFNFSSFHVPLQSYLFIAVTQTFICDMHDELTVFRLDLCHGGDANFKLCVLCDTLYAMCIVWHTLCNVYCVIHFMQCVLWHTLCNVYCDTFYSMCIVWYTLCNVYCVTHFMQCVLCDALYAMCIVWLSAYMLVNVNGICTCMWINAFSSLSTIDNLCICYYYMMNSVLPWHNNVIIVTQSSTCDMMNCTLPRCVTRTFCCCCMVNSVSPSNAS